MHDEELKPTDPLPAITRAIKGGGVCIVSFEGGGNM